MYSYCAAKSEIYVEVFDIFTAQKLKKSQKSTIELNQGCINGCCDHNQPEFDPN